MKLISVIVATRSRPDKIGNCLRSVLANSFSDFEVIVVDQSDDSKTKAIVDSFNSPLVRYFKMQAKGLSKARNLGIKKARGKIIAFTDDDCFVDKNWLGNIHSSFQKHRKILAVFGQALPYKPKQHSGLWCVGITRFRKERVLSVPPQKHFIFSGNTMNIKRKAFNKIGFFKEWLGTGSLGMAGEDEEFVYRLLKSGGKVLVNPQVVVHHNRWLKGKEFRREIAKYLCGLFAATSFYAFQGEKIANHYLLAFFKDKLKEWQREIKFCLRDFHPRYFLRLLLWEIPLQFYYYLRGILVALYFVFFKNIP